MRKLYALLIIVFLTGFVSSHSATHSDLPEPGATPGSLFFGLEKVQESINLALKFSKEKKTQKKIEIAQERLAEAQKLADRNRSKRTDKAIQMYSNSIEEAKKIGRNIPEKRQSNVNTELNYTMNTSTEVLKSLKSKLPESAMKGINRALESHRIKVKPNKSSESNQPKREKPAETPPGITPIDRKETPAASGYVARGGVINSDH